MKVNGIPLKYIALAGICTGTLDILAAFADVKIHYDFAPQDVLKYIGSAVFEPESTPEKSLAMFGLFLHYCISFGFTLLYCLVYPLLKKILRFYLVMAIVYGVLIQAVMRLGLLPLTRLQLGPLIIEKQIKPVLILIGAFGIPLTLFMKGMVKKAKSQQYKTG